MHTSRLTQLRTPRKGDFELRRLPESEDLRITLGPECELLLGGPVSDPDAEADALEELAYVAIDAARRLRGKARGMQPRGDL